MKRTISTLALAAPLATVALSLGATPAMAEPAGPASDQITSTKPGPVNPHLPEDPEEQNPQNDPDPEPEPDPDGSDVPDDKVPTPTPVLDARRRAERRARAGSPAADPCREGSRRRGRGRARRQGRHPAAELHRRRCRLDRRRGMELAWLMAGGGLITATGAAYAVRRRSSMGA